MMVVHDINVATGTIQVQAKRSAKLRLLLDGYTN